MSSQTSKTSILTLFEHSLVRFGQSIAVEGPTQSLTYAQLNHQAEKVALRLAGLGIPERSVVGIFMDGSVEYVVAVLGTIKAGMIFMPMNTVFPGQRLISILDKTNPSVLITDSKNVSQLKQKITTSNQTTPSWPIINIPGELQSRDFLFEHQKTGPGGNITHESQGPLYKDLTDASYIITTSGSTGQPKAILGSNAGLTHFISWEINEFGLDPDVRVSLFSPVTFDVSLRDIFVPLAAGGTLCVPGDETVQNPVGLLNWMNLKKVTVTHMVPTLFRELTRTIMEQENKDPLLPSLKYVFLAGEPVYYSDISRWRQAASNGSKLINLYGPSETTLAKLFHRVDERIVKADETVPIGVPIPDTEALIINDGRACPAGLPGEIHIKTPFMSLGYYNDPQLTRENFVQNPLHRDEESVVYRTGDQGLVDSDGIIRFLGRLDGQVKLYGRRIELGEIESFLRQHRDVSEAAAAVREDASGDFRLIAYIVPREGKKPVVENLRAFLQDKLPDYMLPQVFVNLDALPLTHSGKIDRNALPDLGRQRPEMQSPYIPPANEHERTLCDIWEQVLGLDMVGTRDGFFDLGGTSILSIRLVDRIRQTMGVDLPVVKIFQYPNVSSLAAYIQGMMSSTRTYAGLEERAARRRAAIASRRR